jgi:shikimate kinase
MIPTMTAAATTHLTIFVITISQIRLRATLLPETIMLCIAHTTMTGHVQAPIPPIQLPIVLIGLMGVGKTTIGKRLAARLNIDFIDADQEIEQASALSISEIFERFGEAHFRDGERRVIARLINGAPRVVATGGGAFMNEATRKLILESALAIWIDADIDILADRVARRGNRPMLIGKDPHKVLAALAAVRNPIYALAPIHIRSQPAPHDATVNLIMEALTCRV